VIKVRIKDRTPSEIFLEDLSFLHSLFSLGEVGENNNSQKWQIFFFFACWDMIRSKKAFFCAYDIIEKMLLF